MLKLVVRANKEEKMKLVIHKGAREIGGTCIELAAGNTTLLLDCGLPLSKDSQPIDLAKLHPHAVLVSHPHQDHYGLVENLDAKVPIFIGQCAKSLIDASRIFLRKKPLERTFHFIERNKGFEIGDFKIFPYLVDHSAVDAFAFLLEAEGKRVLYSGDFRAHGRKAVLFKSMVKKPPRDIDVLFMEGTMLDRNNEEFSDEDAVEDTIQAVIKDQTNISFTLCSSQNIDRIVSIYRACLKTKKIMVIDLYTAWVLEQIKLVSKSVPSLEWDQVRVYATYSQYQVLKKNPSYFGSFTRRAFNRRLQDDELKAAPAKYVYLAKLSSFKMIKKFIGPEPVNLIYSEWLGYLEPNNWDSYGVKEILAFKQDPQINYVYAHTSGHAVLEDLKTFAQAINPKRLIPVHTEHAEEFEEHFDNVAVMTDGKEVEI